MANTKDGYGKPTFDDSVDMPQDLQAAVDYADTFAYVRPGTSAERQALPAGKQRAGMLWSESDTGLVYRTDGAGNWNVLNDTGWVNIGTFGSGWSAVAGHTPRVRRFGNRVMIAGAVQRTLASGALADILTIPDGFDYTGSLNFFIGAVVTSGGQGAQLYFSSGAKTKLAIASTYVTASIGSGIILPLTGDWTRD